MVLSMREVGGMIESMLYLNYWHPQLFYWEYYRHGYGLLQRKLNSKRVRYAPIYDGDWEFDKRHGDGTAYYENGSYEGEWKDDCREGLGIMTFCNGSYFIGEWKNDQYHGIGAYYGL